MGSGVQQEGGGNRSPASSAKGKHRTAVAAPARPKGWDDEERNHRAKERTYWLALILIVAVGAVATTILAFWALIDGQSAAVASRQAATEAKRQADAAEQQIAITKSNQTRQLRAYIGFIPGGIENFGDKEKQVFRLIRRNYGLTPAYSVSQSPAVQEVIPINGRIKRPFPLSVTTLTSSETIFPGMDSPLPAFGNPDSPDDSALVKIGKDYQTVIYGAVYYDDVFGERHYTRYCWSFKGPSMTKDDAISCLVHNDSD
jgi:hypothetical protein